MTKSRNLRGKALIEYKNSIKLNDLQRELLIGTLLGDATIQAQKGKHEYTIKFEQKVQKADYIQHLYEIFEPFVGTPPKIRDITEGGAKHGQSIWFRTYGHVCFKFYYDVFYSQKKKNHQRQKRVPTNIHKYLTARGLAYWFMDDGTCHNTHTTRHYGFSTHSFPMSDHKLLVKALGNLDIQTAIHKSQDQYKLSILAQSNNTFLKCIQPYLQSNFLYKIQ